jgi:signal transduction histidine kinase
MNARRRVAEILLLSLLLPLVITLAALQYRWLDKARAADTQRMAAGLSRSAKELTSLVTAQLSALQILFQVDAEDVRTRSWSGFASQWAYWRAHAPFPGLVRDVYLVSPGKGAGATVRQYDPVGRAFREEVPARVSAVASIAGALYPGGGAETAYLAPGLEHFLDIPAVVIPIFGTLPFGPSAFVCVLLDRTVLERDVLPSIVRESFGGDVDERDYDIELIDVSLGRMLYPSGRTVDRAALDAPDLLMPIPAASGKMVVVGQVAQGGGQVSSDAEPSLDLISTLNLMNGKVLTARTQNDAANSLSGFMAGTSTMVEGSNGWLLAVRHRSGSIDRATRDAMLGNLALSLGILLVLGASVVLLYLSFRRAREATARQREFVATVSHELRTPLAVICSAGENLSDGLVRDPDRVKGYGETIRREGRRLRDMVEKVLALSSGRPAGTSRTAAGGAGGEVDVAEIVRAAVALQAAACAEKGIRLEAEIAPNVGTVPGDSAALRAAVQNLVDNAVIHGGAGGVVRVSVSERAGRRGTEIRVRVEDRGKGIARNDLAHLFEPFYRGAAAVADQTPGSGLGLAIAQRAARAHGGAVTVESAPGKGSVFTLMLPGARGPRTI